MRSLTRLTLDFAQRLVKDLATNNVLRGAWAEQLVAHHLDIDPDELPVNWSYYDMRYADRRDISVKQSVGPNPKWSVKMSEWAWDPQLPEQHFLGGPDVGAQYWCDVYVFAWLEAEGSTPELDHVLDASRWRYAVLSRQAMYRAFVPPYAFQGSTPRAPSVLGGYSSSPSS
jgi:hypothetical protein